MNDPAGWMCLALSEAEKGRGGVEPNPMVGAVLVRQDQMLATGHHARFGGPHAEVAALRNLGGDAKGATLYVTLEPCCHHGKTPPCTEAILAAGITRVVVAMRDPFPLVDGGGLAILAAHGVETVVGVEEARSRRLNAPYLKRVLTGRPFVTGKWAMTLDGKTATATGSSRWISNARSRAAVHEARGQLDGIVIGIGTALADDPELTARPAGPRTPVRIVLDPAARLPLDSKLVRSAQEVRVLVATTRRAAPEARTRLEVAGCEIFHVVDSDLVPIPSLLDHLGRQGMTNIMVEGGGRTLGGFLDADQIDAVDLYIAPILEGGPATHSPVLGQGFDAMSQAQRLVHREVTLLDGDIRIQGMIDRPWLHP